MVIAVAIASALAGASVAIQAVEQHVNLSTDAGKSGPLFGVNASDPGQLAHATAQFGRLPIIRVYFPGLPPANAWTSGAVGVNKSAAIVSFRADAQQILSGADDSALRRFFDSAPTGHQIYYSYWAEPETYISQGHFTMAQYRSAWAHIVAIARGAHNPDLLSTLILTNWDLSPSSGRNWKNYLPGGGVISTLGWDAYPAGTVWDKNPQPTPPAQFMGPEVAASESVGLPFGFAEFALGTVTDRPAWLKEVANYLVSVGAQFGTLFDSTGWPWLVLNDAPSIAAWRAVVASSGTGGQLPVSPPPAPGPGPTPTPKPPVAANTVKITGLSISPVAFEAGGGQTTIAFNLSQAADVTVCLLGSNGKVVHLIARPSQRSGLVKISYNGSGGPRHGLLTGTFGVLVVASNSGGSASAEGSVTIRSG